MDRNAGHQGCEGADTLIGSANLTACWMQERAGLDFCLDGQWRSESYVKEFR